MPATPLLLAGIKAATRCQGGQAAVGGRSRGGGRRMVMVVGKEGKMRGGSGGHAVLLLMAVVVGAGPGREGAAVAAVAGAGGGGRVHGALALPAVRVQLLLLVRQNLIHVTTKNVIFCNICKSKKTNYLGKSCRFEMPLKGGGGDSAERKIYCTVLPHSPPKTSYGPWKLMYIKLPMNL
jgi:hypothetical protein